MDEIVNALEEKLDSPNFLFSTLYGPSSENKDILKSYLDTRKHQLSSRAMHGVEDRDEMDHLNNLAEAMDLATNLVTFFSDMGAPEDFLELEVEDEIFIE